VREVAFFVDPYGYGIDVDEGNSITDVGEDVVRHPARTRVDAVAHTPKLVDEAA
jgi:hypothetical protein